MMIAKGKIQNIQVTVGAQNFAFIGGAVGIASGEILFKQFLTQFKIKLR